VPRSCVTSRGATVGWAPEAPRSRSDSRGAVKSGRNGGRSGLRRAAGWRDLARRQFRWGGAQWEPLPAGYREPTSWTRPLRLVTAGYLVLSVLYALITNALFLNPATTERAFRTSVPDASAEQVQQAVTVTVLLGWSFLLVV